MIEQEINDLIARMTDLGFEFTHDDATGVRFKTTNGGEGTLVFHDWDSVSEFVDGQSEKMEGYGTV